MQNEEINPREMKDQHDIQLVKSKGRKITNDLRCGTEGYVVT